MHEGKKRWLKWISRLVEKGQEHLKDVLQRLMALLIWFVQAEVAFLVKDEGKEMLPLLLELRSKLQELREEIEDEVDDNEELLELVGECLALLDTAIAKARALSGKKL